MHLEVSWCDFAHELPAWPGKSVGSRRFGYHRAERHPRTSGQVRWYGVIRQGQGLALWQGRIGTGRCEGVGLRIPDLQVFEDSFDHIDIVDERDDTQLN